MREFTRGESIFGTIIVIMLIAALWIFIPSTNTVSIIRSILISVLGVGLIINFWSMGRTKEPSKSRAVKYIYRMGGWRRKYFSINLKIASFILVAAGIYILFTEAKYWWIGIIAIVLAPMLWYLSNQAKERAEEWLEAGRK